MLMLRSLSPAQCPTEAAREGSSSSNNRHLFQEDSFKRTSSLRSAQLDRLFARELAAVR
jgi:hypothetical protein